jgi:hypothetical protein
MTNFASWPALTSPALESGWIRTHSCGVAFFLGFGLDELGFGVGELDLEELGVGLGLGVVVALGLGVVAGVDDAAPDEDEDAVPEADAVGLDEGLSLVDVAGELADLVDFADEPDLSGDAEELASAAVLSCWAALLVAADSTVLLGMSGHAAELMFDLLLASATCSSANMLQPMNAKPVSAPIAAGLRISALTCESSCTVWLR